MSLAVVKYVTGTRKIAREIRASRDDVKIFVPIACTEQGRKSEGTIRRIKECASSTDGGDAPLNCLLTAGQQSGKYENLEATRVFPKRQEVRGIAVTSPLL